MPKIPVIEHRTTPVGPQRQPRMTPQAAGSGVAAAVSQVAGAGQQVAEAVFEQKRKTEMFEAELQAVENEKSVFEALEVAKQAAPEGAEGFTDEVEQRFDDWVPEAMEAAPETHEAQRALEARTLNLRNRVLNDARKFQARSKAALDLRRAADAQDAMVNHARSAPEERDGTLQRHAEFIAAAPFPDEQSRAKALEEGEHRILAGALDGLVRTYELNPRPVEEVDKAIAALKKGALGYKERVEPRAFDDALTRLENRKKSLETESKALYGKDMADLLAAISVNGPAADTGEVTLQRALEVRKNDKLAKRDMLQIEEAKRLYTAQQSLAQTSTLEDRQLLEQTRQDVSGLGAAFKKANLTRMEKAMKNKWKEYKDDQVAYVYKANPGIAEMARQAEESGDEQQRDDAVAMLKQAQQDMGTPMWGVEVIGKGNAKHIADGLNGLPAEAAADEIEKLQDRYRKDWPLAMRELEQAKVSPGLLVLGRLNTLADVGLRKQLAGFMQVGKAEMRKNIGNTTATDIDARVDDLIPTFAATLYHAGRTGQETVAREREAMSTLAYGLVQTGLSPNDAAEEAFNLLLGNRYDFGPTYRTAKGEIGLVERAADIEINLAKPDKFLPPSLGPGADPRLTAEETAPYLLQVAYDNAINQGIWVNNQMGTGLLRLAPDAAGTYAPVRLASGEQWEILFADVRENPPTAISRLGTPFPAEGFTNE